MKKYKNLFTLIIGIVTAAVILNGCGQEAEKEVKEQVVPVNVFVVSPDTISNFVKVTGGVTASEDAVLYSKVSEKIKSVNVKPGDKVYENKVIAVQDNSLLYKGIQYSKSVLENARIQLKQVMQEYERMERLYKENAISQQQYDQIVTQKEMAEASLEQARTGLEQAEEQYQHSIIKAPFSGVVASVYVEKDQMVPAGQPVAQIVKSSNIKAKLKVSSIDIARLSLGQKVLINFPAIPDETFYGEVVRIDEAVDPVTKLLEVEVRAKNRDKKIKSGMFAEFNIVTDVRTDRVVVPDNAIMTQTEVKLNKNTGKLDNIRKHFVYTVKDSIANLMEIQPGISSDGMVEVVSGLNAGDEVIIVGQKIVKNGQKVKIVD